MEKFESGHQEDGVELSLFKIKEPHYSVPQK